jgi:hypothetical protein
MANTLKMNQTVLLGGTAIDKRYRLLSLLSPTFHMKRVRAANAEDNIGSTIHGKPFGIVNTSSL